jgi:hypothetical protein
LSEQQGHDANQSRPVNSQAYRSGLRDWLEIMLRCLDDDMQQSL